MSHGLGALTPQALAQGREFFVLVDIPIDANPTHRALGAAVAGTSWRLKPNTFPNRRSVPTDGVTAPVSICERACWVMPASLASRTWVSPASSRARLIWCMNAKLQALFVQVKRADHANSGSTYTSLSFLVPGSGLMRRACVFTNPARRRTTASQE